MTIVNIRLSHVRGRGQAHGDVPGAILAAAVTALEEGGDLSLRALARRAGVSHAAPYNHFRDRDAVLLAVATEGFRRLSAVQDDVEAVEPIERLAELVHAYLVFARTHPAHYGVMLDAIAGRLGARDEAFEQAARGTFDVLAAAVAACAPDVWAMAHGLVVIGPLGEALDDALTTRQTDDEVLAHIVAIASAPNAQSS
jgi:AcrR family transcriptional regulator